MPIPKPNEDEGHDDFIDRCMGDDTMGEEYPDNDDRLGVCQTQWDESQGEPESESKSAYAGGKREIRILDVAGLEVEKRAEKNADGMPKLRGYAAVFDKPTELFPGLREKVAPGAFTRTLKEGADVRALFNHNPDIVLGRNKAGTLELTEDKKGLRVVISPPDTQAARDLITSVKRDDVNQMSFAVRVRKEQWEDFEDGWSERTMLDVDLFDVSVVTYPAYPETTIAARMLERRHAGLDMRIAWSVSPTKAPERPKLADKPAVEPELHQDNPETLEAAAGILRKVQNPMGSKKCDE